MDRFLEMLKQIKFINNSFFIKKNKISINKKNNNIKFKILPHFIKSNNEKDTLQLYKSIRHYLTVMNKECKNFNSNIFIKNFKKTLFNIENLNKNVVSDFDGTIDLDDINQFEINKISVINHELLHLSSLQKNYDNVIFSAYDEGYTQLLAERYFKENEGKVYKILVIIMNNIETIINKDYMEEKYFKGELQTTGNKLLEYENKENIKLLFKNMYFIFDTLNNIHCIEEEKRKIYIQYHTNIIFTIITNCIINRLKKCDNIKDKISIFNNLRLVKTYRFVFMGQKYEINLFTDEQIKQIINCLYSDLEFNVEEEKRFL